MRMNAWDVYLPQANGRNKHIDTVFYDASYKDADEVKRSLVNHDGYPPNIIVRKA